LFASREEIPEPMDASSCHSPSSILHPHLRECRGTFRWLRTRSALLVAGLVLALIGAACRTAPPPRSPNAPTKVALISDLHVMPPTTNKDQRLFPLRLAKTIEAVNAANVDLVLVAGDLTEHGTPQEYGLFRSQMRRFSAPVFYVPGNHDVGNKSMPGKQPGPGFGRIRAYELDCGKSFFVHDCAGVRVIGLNSSLFGSHTAREKQMWAFLEDQLEKPAKRPTLLLQHYPPFMKKADEPGGDYFNLEPYPRARLLALAQQGGVKAILSGHLHHGLTNYANGMVLLTTPPISYGLPNGKQPEGWTLLTVTKKDVTWEFQPLPTVTWPAPPKPATPATPAKPKKAKLHFSPRG
jgi:3',5'-cyclic-AMP phosphodiesterase